MSATFEQKLLKALLSQKFYERARGIVADNFFEKEARTIFLVTRELHEKYERDLTLSDVREVVMETTKLTTAGKHMMGDIFELLDATEAPHEDITMDILSVLYKKNKAFEIGEIVADIINGKSRSLDEIKEVLASAKGDPETPLGTVTTDVTELLTWNDPSKRYGFIEPLQSKVGGAGPGHLVGVFARPDIGKSSFVAALAVHFARQGLVLDYFGNEEPGQKLGLNCIRSATGLSDTALYANIKRGISTYDAWEAVKDRIRIHDVVGYSVEEMDKFLETSGSNIAIADQIDKFSIKGVYENSTQKYKDIYVYTREIAKKRNVLMIDVCQAGAEAQGKKTVTYDMMDGSKTGKAGELDLAIGIGINSGPVDDMVRYLTVSKNKINGWKGEVAIDFNPFTNTWKAIS